MPTQRRKKSSFAPTKVAIGPRGLPGKARAVASGHEGTRWRSMCAQYMRRWIRGRGTLRARKLRKRTSTNRNIRRNDTRGTTILVAKPEALTVPCICIELYVVTTASTALQCIGLFLWSGLLLEEGFAHFPISSFRSPCQPAHVHTLK